MHMARQDILAHSNGSRMIGINWDDGHGFLGLYLLKSLDILQEGQRSVLSILTSTKFKEDMMEWKLEGRKKCMVFSLKSNTAPNLCKVCLPMIKSYIGGCPPGSYSTISG